MKSKFAIIIPFYHGNRYLSRCLQSIVASVRNHTNIKVFIIKNDQEETIIDTSLNLDIELIQTEPNIGFARASNLGVYMAQFQGYEYVIIQNQDSHWINDSLGQLMSNMTKFPNAYHSSLLCDYYTEEPNISFLKSYVYRIRPELLRVDFMTYRNKIKVERVAAAGLGFSVHLLDKNALFDPIFYHYGEDYDFFERIKPTLYIWPQAKLGHVDGDAKSRDLSHQAIQLGVARIKKGIRFRGFKTTFKNYLGLINDGISFYKSISFCLGITKGLLKCLMQYSSLTQYDKASVKKRILIHLERDATLSHNDHFTKSILKH